MPTYCTARNCTVCILMNCNVLQGTYLRVSAEGALSSATLLYCTKLYSVCYNEL